MAEAADIVEFSSITALLIKQAAKELSGKALSLEESDEIVGSKLRVSAKSVSNWRTGRAVPVAKNFAKWMLIAKKICKQMDIDPEEYERKWQEARALVHQDDTAGIKTPKRIDENDALNFIYSKAEEESNKISYRLSSRMLTTESMTHINCFGWVATSGYAEKVLRPSIPVYHALYLIKRSIWIGIEFDSREDRAEMLRILCSVRYLMFCFLHAIAEEIDPHMLVDEIASGIESGEIANGANYKEAVWASVRTISVMAEGFESGGAAHDAVTEVRSLLRKMGSLAKCFGLTIADVAEEEQEEGRNASRASRMASVGSKNLINYQVEIWIEDRQGSYSRLMRVFDHANMHMNVIRSVSETLVPERIASIKLLVFSEDEQFASKINALVKSEDLRRLVVSLHVKYVGDENWTTRRE